MNRIINTIINQLVRRFVNIGIGKSINHFAVKGKPSTQMTRAEKAQSKTGREAAKRARQAAKLTRRLGR